jgi:hypothetical protein
MIPFRVRVTSMGMKRTGLTTGSTLGLLNRPLVCLATIQRVEILEFVGAVLEPIGLLKDLLDVL